MPFMPPIDLGKIVVNKNQEQGIDMNPQELGGALQAVGQVMQKSNMPVRVPASIMGLFTNMTTPQQQQGQQSPSSAPIPQSVPMAQQPQEQLIQDTGVEKQPNKFWEFLKRAGVPLGAAIAGTAFPGALPEAAGLATGWEGAKQREDENLENLKREYLRYDIENSGEKEFIIVDPETGEQKKIMVPKAATVQQKRSNGLDSQIAELVAEKIGGENKSRIRVREISTGETGTIDSSEFDPKLYEKL